MKAPWAATFTGCLLLATCWAGLARGADFDVRRFGATGDGVSSETAAIQKAIDECTRQGGGTVTFPAGRYVTGTIMLKNDVQLQLEAGSTILGSTNIADYSAIEPFTEGTGQSLGWCLIGALGARNIGIAGPGTIDGRGRELNAARPPSARGTRPAGLRFVDCDGVSLDNLHLQAAAMWMVHFAHSRNVRADKVTLSNHVAANNDGFDIDSCDGVQITNCDVDSEDDAICLKSTYPVPSRNISVSHCRLRSGCSTIKLGTESLGGFENVSISNIEVLGAGFGGINIFCVDGGDVAHVTMTDIDMAKVNAAIVLRLGARLRTFRPADLKKPVGTMRDLTIKNVTAKFAHLEGIIMSGIPGHRIEDVSLENIQITVEGGGTANVAGMIPPELESAYPESTMFGKNLPAYGMFARHVHGLKLTNCKIISTYPDARPLYYTQDVDGLAEL